jgi:hypothetical protein
MPGAGLTRGVQTADIPGDGTNLIAAPTVPSHYPGGRDRTRMRNKENRMRGLLLRGRIWLLSAVSGGSLLVLSGCDPNVRDTILGGVESSVTTLFTTFIQAFFETVLAADDDSTVTTVRAIVEQVPEFFA